MTDDTAPGTGVSNRWGAAAERLDRARILEAHANKGKRKPKTQREESE